MRSMRVVCVCVHVCAMYVCVWQCKGMHVCCVRGDVFVAVARNISGSREGGWVNEQDQSGRGLQGREHRGG